MNLRLLSMALAALLVACGASPEPAPEAVPAEAADTWWTCSMHPQVHEDGPGRCPLCGMDLVQVAAATAGDPTVTVDPRIVQTTGIRTRRVTRTTLFRHLRALGQVEAAEDRVAVVNPRVAGWVQELLVDTTGAEVRAGQTLMTVYAPELVEAQQELRLAPSGSPRASAAAARLQRLGVANTDVARVRSRGVMEAVPVRAPRGGTVTLLGVAEGDRVTPGATAFRIVDLSTVWVVAEVYEADAPWVEVGQRAEIDLPDRPGEPVEATVDFVYPTLDPRRRTLRVRFAVDNGDGALRPGQFATVRLGFRRKDDVLAVPRQAVLTSGERSIVFVHEGEGRFLPREVVTGLEGDRSMVEVVSGLHPGEEIVHNGLFLLDAESRLQEAFRGLEGADEAQAVPDHYACPMHPEQASDTPGACPVCGMDLEPVFAEDGGHGHAGDDAGGTEHAE